MALELKVPTKCRRMGFDGSASKQTHSEHRCINVTNLPIGEYRPGFLCGLKEGSSVKEPAARRQQDLRRLSAPRGHDGAARVCGGWLRVKTDAAGLSGLSPDKEFPENPLDHLVHHPIKAEFRQ
jgi:hypothetical protein